MKLMNDSLDFLVNNLTCDIYNTICKHCMKCKDSKKYEKCTDSKFKGCEACIDCKKERL